MSAHHRHLYTLVLLVVFAGGAAEARDEFAAVRCGSDVPKALKGGMGSDEPVAAIEARHRDLGLKNLGGDEVADGLNVSSWRVCGNEYQVLYGRGNVVRDVLPLPNHSRKAPEFSGSCMRAGQKLPGVAVAILANGARDRTASHYSTDDQTLLPATSAWRIDRKNERFVPLSTAGLTCPRSGIVTADGGP